MCCDDFVMPGFEHHVPVPFSCYRSRAVMPLCRTVPCPYRPFSRCCWAGRWKCETWKVGTKIRDIKIRDMKMREMKMREMKMWERKMRNMKMREKDTALTYWTDLDSDCTPAGHRSVVFHWHPVAAPPKCAHGYTWRPTSDLWLLVPLRPGRHQTHEKS